MSGRHAGAARSADITLADRAAACIRDLAAIVNPDDPRPASVLPVDKAALLRWAGRAAAILQDMAEPTGTETSEWWEL